MFKKNDKLNIDESINKVEKWFTDYQRNIHSTYKIFNPRGKSIQLTLSTQFHEILKKMHGDSKDCKLLNGLLTSNALKVKSSYLADNNINALAANIGSDGDATLSYADAKSILQKEIGMIRNYLDTTKLKDPGTTLKSSNSLEEKLRRYRHELKENLPIIYDKVYSTPTRRKDLFYEGNTVHTKHVRAFNSMREVHDALVKSLILNPSMERYGSSHAPILFAYISINTRTSLLVDRMTKGVVNFLEDSNIILTPGDWVKDKYPQHVEIKKDFERTFIDTDVVWNVLRDTTCYYEKNIESLLKVVDAIKEKTTPFNEIFKSIEDWNTENMLNMLAVVESALKFINKVFDNSNSELYTRDGETDSLSRTLRRLDMLSYDFSKMIKSLGVTCIMPNSGLMYIGIPEFRLTLDKNYKDYLKALYKSNFREQCKIGKISSKLYNKHYTAVEVEDFASLFKKQMLVNSIVHDIRIVEGPLVSYYYNTHAYARRFSEHSLLFGYNPVLIAMNEARNGSREHFINANMEGGSLQYSCMRYPHRFTRTKLYADNPNVYKMLVALDEDGRLKARAMLEYHKDGKIYLDRVYASNEKVRLEMFTWAEQRGFISLHRTNGSYREDLKYTSDDNLILELEKPIRKDTPYLDSMKIQSDVGIMAKKDLGESKKVELENKIIEKRIKKSTRQELRLLNLEMVEKFRENAVSKNYVLSKEYDLDIKTGMKTEHIEKKLEMNHTWGVHFEIPAHNVHTLQVSFKKKTKDLFLPMNMVKNPIKVELENLEKQCLNVQRIFLRTASTTTASAA